MKKIILSMMAACAMFFATSCENSDVTFDNYDYQTVYFATQYPVRTITLGEDAAYPNEDDNQHKFQIKATLGGDRNLKSEHKIKIVVDNSLCDGLKYSNGQAVQPMPAEYYQLADSHPRKYRPGRIGRQRSEHLRVRPSVERSEGLSGIDRRNYFT